jgi:hypothetical protein
MNNICYDLHHLFGELPRFRFPFDTNRIPLNGVYLLFERGEIAHGTDRITRVGSHTGDNQLRSRLNQHFFKENKDRSIFRKNIGRALLKKAQDPFLSQWEIDLTTREAKTKYGRAIDFDKLKSVEHQVTAYLRDNFSFVVFCVNNRNKRLELESKIISTISSCDKCGPSEEWLGLYSSVLKIQKSGLWLVNHLYKEPLSEEDVEELKTILGMNGVNQT